MMDHFGLKPPKVVYVIWSKIFSFALGLMVANFSSILDHFELRDKSSSRIATLVLGLLVGIVLYCVILFGESKGSTFHWFYLYIFENKTKNKNSGNASDKTRSSSQSEKDACKEKVSIVCFFKLFVFVFKLFLF
jgi:hypothetical protein